MKRVLLETDIPNPIDGGNCYVWAKVYPRWYVALRYPYRFARCFLIVWCGDFHGVRIDFKTALDLARILA